MDKLTDLPENRQTVLRPDEKEVMEMIFGESEPEKESFTDKLKNTKWRLLIAVVGLYVIMSIPLVDAILSRSENGMINLAIKTTVYLVVALILFLFL